MLPGSKPVSSSSSSNSSPVLHKEFPHLFGKDKAGKTRVWQASVFAIDRQHPSVVGMAVIQHGIYGGKLQVDTRHYTEGKNIGRKNETTPLAQCLAETEKKWKDKMEKESYTTTPYGEICSGTGASTASVVVPTQAIVEAPTHATARKVFPMLANKYEPASSTKKKHSILYPCYVQPKLDGLRCVVYLGANERPVYQSRTGGTFEVLTHLDDSILSILRNKPDTILDGELYTTRIPFEELAGLIKKKALASAADRTRIQQVQYHVYDIVLGDIAFKDRFDSLQQLVAPLSSQSHICVVPTSVVGSVEAFKEKFSEFVEAGYEGIMLRNTAGLYQENYRSNDLLKYKEFFESEYPIVAYREATGRDAGTVVWECETPEGRRFSVRPRGSLEMRRRWFESAKSIVGKNLTVIYQELSEMGVPRFPVGKAIREGY
jgi:hypothetical protein